MADFLNELTKIILTKNKSIWCRFISSNKTCLSLYNWLVDKTKQYDPINLMESIYIIVNGPPTYCKRGNKPRFVRYATGYQQFCKQGCECFKESASDISKEIYESRTEKEKADIEVKIKATNQDRYGASRASATKLIIDKTKETNLDRYGHISFTGSITHKERSVEIYGVDHPFKSEIVKDKIKETNLGLYGTEWSFSSSVIRDKINQTNLEKYGTIYPTQNDEIKDRIHITLVDNGVRVRDDDKSDWDIYKSLSKFNGPIDRFIQSKDDEILVETIGTFDSINDNTNGVVRDHIFSRRHGYDNKIFCEILRHPANCQLMTHSSNASKGLNSNITIDELFIRIKEYNKSWHEHEKAVSLIDKYISGERWIRPVNHY